MRGHSEHQGTLMAGDESALGMSSILQRASARTGDLSESTQASKFQLGSLGFGEGLSHK